MDRENPAGIDGGVEFALVDERARGEARGALGKLLASRTFQMADVQRRFLRYAVEEALAGRGHLIKEYVIGVEGLGRPDTFDPRMDPIVRTEARKLRARLAKYYETEGEAEKLRIEFPKGSYAPVFRLAAESRHREKQDVEASESMAPMPAEWQWRRAAIGQAVLLVAALVWAYIAQRPETTHLPAASLTSSPAAFQDYERGRHFLRQFSPDGVRTAKAYFERAIAEDPRFAQAYSALADSYIIAHQVLSADSPEVVSGARRAAGKALELDRSLADAHFDLAVCAEFDFDWRRAEEEFQRGLKLNQRSVTGHLWYAKYLALTGRKPEVLTHRRVAADLDPASPYALQAVAGYFSVIGQYDRAIELFQGALAIEPRFGLAHQGLGVAYLLKGMRDEAIGELQVANEFMSGPKRMALLGYAYGLAGRKDDANRILDRFLGEYQRGAFPALAVALVYLGLGDRDRAFGWLDKAVDQRDLDLTLQWDSPYDAIRSDPRYPKLLRRMKLAP